MTVRHAPEQLFRERALLQHAFFMQADLGPYRLLDRRIEGASARGEREQTVPKPYRYRTEKCR